MKRFLLSSCILMTAVCTYAQQSTTFEMRYLTKDSKANGITDFHGETEYLNTEERIEFLDAYADYASRFWGDPNLDKPLFTDEQVRQRTIGIKPQPTTKVRRTIDLKEWKSYGYRKGCIEEQERSWAKWAADGAEIGNGCLTLNGTSASPQIDPLDWRFTMKASFRGEHNGVNITLKDENALPLVLDIDDNIGNLEIYCDLPNRKVFMSSEGKTQKVLQLPEKFGKTVSGFTIDALKGKANVEKFSLYGFVRDEKNRSTPYWTKMLLDEDFNRKMPIEGWQKEGYDDSGWEIVTLPSPHGSQSEAGESYYLRTKVNVGSFKYASLYMETLDPAGEVWVNGEAVAVLKGRIPRHIDIREYLIPEQENTIAVRVKPYFAEHTMHHTPSDHNIGWFLGRTQLILTDELCHIAEGLVHTSSLTDSQAMQKHKITVRNETAYSDKGQLTISYYPWFPADGPCVATVSKDIEIRPRVNNVYDIELALDSPLLWQTSDPQLYRVEITLKDEDGKAIDDFVTTTGVRLIEQKEGVLYINHKPEMLNGAQIFGYRLPIEYVSKYIRCATDEMVMRDLMMIESLGGNLLRVHIQAEKDISDGTNDPRYAEFADQMGIYLIWQTAAWIREGEAWNVEMENYPLYMKQVYNHPSIVLWEASNHPNRFKNHDFNDTHDYFSGIITSITGTDTSRLVSPTSFWPHSHYANYDGTLDYKGGKHETNPLLRHKMMTRGSQDAYTGYGADWSQLRKFPNQWSRSCLEAKELCYFNFEHEESAAQPNWELAKKDPWYEIPSYEWEYEHKSIGRLLEFNEWRASQAFQAFSAWESMKLQTLAGVSGYSWCSIESGANMYTYQKPLIDPYYVPKLAFHANTMAFQKIWAASSDVDTVYGPDDMITPVIFNMGEACKVNLTIELQNTKGRTIERKIFRNIDIEAGRSVRNLDSFRFSSRNEGSHFIVYKIQKI